MTRLISASDIREQAGVSSAIMQSHRNADGAPKAVRLGREFYYEHGALDYFRNVGALKDGDMDEKTSAAYLGLGTIVFRNLRKNGSSPKFRKVGNQIVYNREDLDAWADTQFHDATSN